MSHVLASAFCDRELFRADLARMEELGVKPKFVAAECGDQHAASVRSPEGSFQNRIGWISQAVLNDGVDVGNMCDVVQWI